MRNPLAPFLFRVLFAAALIDGALASVLDARSFEDAVEQKISALKRDNALANSRRPEASRADGRLFVYTIAISRVKIDGVAPRPWGHTTGAIAKFIQDSGLGRECVDLRSLGAAASNDIMSSGSEGVVMRTPIPFERWAEAICKDHLDCRIQVRSQAVELSRISILGHGAGPAEKRSEQKFRLNAGTKLPTFSNACATGQYEHSWNDAAGTRESRDFLHALGFDIRKARVIGLTADVQDGASSGSEGLWTFGFVDHTKD